MYPSQHLFVGTLFGLVLLILFPHLSLIGFLIIVFSSVLIDVDHYLYYIYKKRDWNLKNAYDWSISVGKKYFILPRKQRNEFYLGFCFLHGIEVLLIFFLLSFISKYFFFVFIGLAFHLLVDLIHEPIYWDRVDKFSLIYDYFKFKKLKNIEE